jgi:MFS transporter, DHA3 family, macrolide efflux protein
MNPPDTPSDTDTPAAAKSQDSAADDAAAAPAERLGRNFYLLWLGQFVSNFGSALSAFALAVWLYQQTGSVLDFTNMTLAATLPALFVTPFAGSFADRHDKRMIMMVGDTFAALSMLTVGLLVWSNKFQVWHLYVAEALASLAIAFTVPAAIASVTSLVPKSQFGRSVGMFQAASGIATLSAPLVAGMLLGVIGLTGIVLLDVASFIIGVTCLLFLRIPKLANAVIAPLEQGSNKLHTALKDFGAAIKYYRQHPSLRRIYSQLISASFITGLAASLFTPLVLSTNSERSLAVIVSIGSVGGLLGGIFMAVWGGPKKWVPWLLLLNIGEGVALIMASHTGNPTILGISAFYVFFSTSLLGACVHTVWQRKVPVNQQGSVMSLQHSIELSLAPIGVTVGGLMVHYLFNPWLEPGGMLTDNIGKWLIPGNGSGIAMLFFCAGVLLIVLTILALLSRNVWNLERQVPDAM